MIKQQELYSGKAKSLYSTDNPEQLIMFFRDDTSAFDGQKIEQLSDKGRVNNYFNAHIMQLLNQHGIPTGFLQLLSEQESLVKKLKMLPVECVIRNYTAGGLVRRYGIDSGVELNPPLIEFFIKDDARHDPLITEELIIRFGWATKVQLKQMREYTNTVNQVLVDYFLQHGLLLVDFKLEFGISNDELCLGDEFTPDGCRIWDKDTKEIYDKDRFRKGLGGVVAGYRAAAEKLGIAL